MSGGITGAGEPSWRQPGASEELIGELAQALGGLRLMAAPTWATVQKVGVLRVGTTGDYAPFSDDRGGELRGLDVELAQDLAKTWGVTSFASMCVVGLLRSMTARGGARRRRLAWVLWLLRA